MTPTEISMAVVAGMGVINTVVGVLTFLATREVRHHTNSMNTEMVRMAKLAGKAEEKAEGKAETAGIKSSAVSISAIALAHIISGMASANLAAGAGVFFILLRS